MTYMFSCQTPETLRFAAGPYAQLVRSGAKRLFWILQENPREHWPASLASLADYGIGAGVIAHLKGLADGSPNCQARLLQSFALELCGEGLAQGQAALAYLARAPLSARQLEGCREAARMQRLLDDPLPAED
ncbi:MAG: hypothetical protein HUK26_06295 [Duodenibacillus sp.]|nr:hypothetical protein [Duodenibacillus sp.]